MNTLDKEQQYPFKEIEASSQAYWEANGSFNAEKDTTKEKFYCLSMFPYPSGKLHIGHVRTYTLGDIIARYQILQGKNVLQPIGWDAFGLPAENASQQSNLSPREWTYKNIGYMKQQLKKLGYGYDWRREFATCDTDYYKWEQQLFTKLIEPNTKGGAYRKKTIVNWDPVDKTVLANEQVIDGCGWRSGAKVKKQERYSWFLKITDYAEELHSSLKKLHYWPKQVVKMQENWIGRSEGAIIKFKIVNNKNKKEDSLEVYTTRPDTIYGATFLAISPYHHLAKIEAKEDSNIAQCVDLCKSISESESEDKIGIQLKNHQAIHPLTKKLLPIYIANYVLIEYGSGAIMAVPANDERDREFAEKYTIPIVEVIKDNTLINSKQFNTLDCETAKIKITEYLTKNSLGKKQINYRLRDWGISRQRYWGCPIPVIYSKDNHPHPAQVPVELPTSPPENSTSSHLIHDKEFIQSVANGFSREADTFDTFFESSWYYARFASYNSNNSMLDKNADYWLPVDQYVGGVEHAVLHLLYARYFHRLMRDQKMITTDEPFVSLLTQGMVVAPSYRAKNDKGIFEWIDPQLVVKKDGIKPEYYEKETNREVEFVGIEKMSKSKKNGVNPESIIDSYGADALRLYITFAAPPTQQLEWSASSLSGCYKFCKKLYNLAKSLEGKFNSIIENGQPPILKSNPSVKKVDEAILKALHDYEKQQFNTVVSATMIIYNEMVKMQKLDMIKELCRAMHSTLILLSPIAPHLCQHLFQMLGFGEDILQATWLQASDFISTDEVVQTIVQVDGKKRGLLTLAKGLKKEEVVSIVLENEEIKPHIKKYKKAIHIPNRLINIVNE